MPRTYHISIKKDFTSLIKEDLQEKNSIEFVHVEKEFDVPLWQQEEVLNRKKYYIEHPEELISWEEAEKMIRTDV